MGIRIDCAYACNDFEPKRFNELPTIEQADNSIDFSAPKKNTATNPIEKNISQSDIKKLVNNIIDEDVEKEKSTIRKGFDWIVSLFKPDQKKNGLNRIASAFWNKAKSIHNNLKYSLKQKGVDISSLSEEDRKKYLELLLKHALGKIDNSQFLAELKEFQSMRTKQEVNKNIPKALNTFTNFLKSHFASFFSQVGKMNVAAVEIAIQASSKDIAEQLKILYANTALDARKDILKAALSQLPENFSQDNVLEFCIASEKMTEEEIDFLEDLISSSDMPEEDKQRKFEELAQERKNLRNNSKMILINRIASAKNLKYNTKMPQIDKSRRQIDNVEEKQEDIKEKQVQIKKEHEILYAQLEKQKEKYRILKTNQNKNNSFSQNSELSSVECAIKSTERKLSDLETSFACNKKEIEIMDNKKTVLMNDVSNNIHSLYAYKSWIMPKLET